MNGEQLGKDFRETETIDQAVRRLIGVMDERKKRRASGAQSPEQIHDPAQSLLDEWPEAGNTVGSIAASGLTVADVGSSNGYENFGRAGLQVTDYVSEKISPKETARPALDASLTRVDRAVTRSRGCK